MAVIGVFLIGLLATVVSVIRVIQIHKLFFVTPSPETDHFHTIGPVTSSIEVNLAIFCACIPALRPLFCRWMPRLFGGTAKKTIEKGYSGKYATGSLRNPTGAQEGNDISIKEMPSRAHCTELRSVSPTSSEEEIMTYSGIVRTTSISVQYESNTSVNDVESRPSSEYKTSGWPEKGTAF
ncbi:integral membrane protein [Colletotrichum orchidophilum]|uniref:Integral membrane protein n=1 Tax=Colletotrichum orchidophilum TaxID=1209926 RepID=A0A1G4B8D9_9PEZI|nr:uncharacterized protein CORC01_06906 [Colletotrichum orchidophilum]OHE97701.1 integral membrane protein [Colletotrichum orchidophilum]